MWRPEIPLLKLRFFLEYALPKGGQRFMKGPLQELFLCVCNKKKGDESIAE